MLTGTNEDRALVRSAAIHILDKWEAVPDNTKPIWTDIIEAVGFYPYIAKNADSAQLDSLADKIRKKSFLSEYLPDTYMHTKQKELSDYLLSSKNVVASAPTSFGKSLLIEELVASMKYNNIVIIQPTLALLDETRIRMKKYNCAYKIIVRTSQEADSEKRNLFLLTAERVMEYANLPHIDLLIIDEFYKMSLRRIDERADTLNNAFLKIYDRYSSKFYLLGPNIDGITEGFSEKYNADFFKTDYSLVDCDVVPVNTRGFTKSQKEEKLFELLDSHAGQQTLVYCNAPQKARKLARNYLAHLKQKGIAASVQLPIIEWLHQNIRGWSLSEELLYGVAIHDGSLPKHLGASIIQYFNKGLIRCIFCTSTIIEGVNTSAKNVVIFDNKKGNKDIDFFDYSNIKGRAGRLMEHYVGNVYCFNPIPPKNTVTIDIPFVEQDAEILSDEILINIRDIDVQSQVRDRFTQLNGIETELLGIIKQNGTDVNGQMAIYYTLMRDITTSERDNIVWSHMPDWNKMEYILSISVGKTFEIDKHGVFSVRQLTYFLNLYRNNKSILQIAQDIYKEKIKNIANLDAEKKIILTDDAIETAFHIYRYWFQFAIPKAFRVVDSLQRYVCEKRGIKAGSYTYFVQQLENDFLRENLSILVEYGIPTETVRKLIEHIPDTLSEDDVLLYIQKNRNRLFASLMEYEKERLIQCL
jgi:hypothetical protein